MKNIIARLPLGLFLLGGSPIIAQNLWTEIKNPIIEGEQKIQASAYKVFQLDDLLFRQNQSLISEGFSSNATQILLPTPTGNLESFNVFEEKIMHPALSAKYPAIKTYTAIHSQHKNIVAKLDYTLFGFHGMVSNGINTYFIDPLTNKNTGNYMVYYKRNGIKAINYRMECAQDPNDLVNGDINLNTDLPPSTGVAKVNGTARKNYDLALACTGEYAVAVAGPVPTKAAVLSAMVTSINRVSGIYELEFAVHLNLIANNDTLIYLDGTIDPYTNNSGGTMLGENATTLAAVIGNANFDIGHVFSTGGGGVASLSSVCSNTNKARGVTGLANPVGDGFDVDYVSHEMGHQFAGSHTFDALTGSCSGNRSSTSAYEVGSGTTIQAYAGICGFNNVQPHSDAYFTIRSLNQMGTFITTGGGATCPDSIGYGNTPPIVTPIADTFYMPHLTYFELTAQATDAENDTLSYCWEQYNRGSAGMDWDAPTVLNPIFRSFTPSKNSTRVFPIIDSCINNVYTYKGERSPDTARSMRFKVAVRDVHNGYGCFNYSEDSVIVNVIQGAELFRVTSHDVPNLTYLGNVPCPVTWNIAGTDTGVIAAKKVNIYLSTDSGYTYPILLSGNTANDGEDTVIMPNIDVQYARIKVKAADNIWFDLNNTVFAIKKTNYPEGISNTVLNQITIGPNPTDGFLQINNVSKPTKFVLLNTVGQVLYTTQASKATTLDISKFAKGIYFLQMQIQNEASRTVQIVKY
jgi:hypothetical protein